MSKIQDELRRISRKRKKIKTRESALENIEGKRIFDIEQFGKIFKTGRFPEGFDKNMEILREILKTSEVVSLGDTNKVLSLLGTLLARNKNIDTLSLKDLKVIEEGLEETNFPRNWKEIFKSRYISNFGVKRQRADVNAYLIRNYNKPPFPAKISGFLSLDRPVWMYVKTGIDFDEYKFVPSRLSNISDMERDQILDLKYKALIPVRTDINEDGVLVQIRTQEGEEAEFMGQLQISEEDEAEEEEGEEEEGEIIEVEE